MVFAIGMCVAALMERRAEVASVFNNRRTPMSGIVARNDLFKDDFPREYNTWEQTADTTFESEFNGSQAKDVLAMRPAMGYSGLATHFRVIIHHPAAICTP